MKLKKIRVPRFVHKDNLGMFEFSDVAILFDPETNEITPENFDQDKHEYFIDDAEIEKMAHDSAIRFYNDRAKEILQDVKPLTALEVKGIRDFFGVTGAGLGDLIGLDKSSISRVLSSKQPIMHDKAKSLMDSLREEINSPGYNKIVLSNLKPNFATDTINRINASALEIAEYFVRKFEELESSITQLKLQKLIYYAQGIGFGRYGIKLIDEPLLAWKHGPVVRSVYDKYRDSGKSPLSSAPEMKIENIESNEMVINILEETIALYGIYDAWVLRTKTHNESPWLETPRDHEITDEKMNSFFKKLLV